MKLVVFRVTFNILFLCFIAFCPAGKLSAQVIDSSTLVRKIDFRGKRPQSAVVAALSASREKVVVVLVRGGSDKLISGAEGQMKALIHGGYNRIGMVISDNPPDEMNPAISVFSSGQVYAVVEDVKDDARTGWALFNLVKDAYEEDIISKSGKGVSQGQNEED